MRRFIPILIVMAAASPALAETALIPVPFFSQPKAAFFPIADATVPTAVARGADGVKLVVCEGAVVSGLDGSQLEADCTPKSDSDEEPFEIRLMTGGFHVHVGSRPARVALKGAGEIELVSSAMIAIKSRRGWVVQVKSMGEEGIAKRLTHTKANEPKSPVTPNPENDETTEEAAALEQTTRQAIPIPSGKRFAISGTGPFIKADPKQSKILGDSIQGLYAGVPKRSPLVSKRVEDPKDLLYAGAGSEGELGDLEIEAIEVEVGCVEVCVD